MEFEYGDNVLFTGEKAIFIDYKSKEYFKICRIFFLSKSTTHGYRFITVPSKTLKKGW